ncbi:HlyD family efflux transporter periplasmic adaptor subunit [Rhodopirellula sp. JC639]|uniref:HlyD family efflux transporter periplasmic adaptor subunit n=1 Tax=Stieleria mannarensis TaxID=2755585 RepID=UPI0015FF481C|nr:HlyD family efflux transporter periplasmic adaptor subunit [Rhodopirellula sp. JC639]
MTRFCGPALCRPTLPLAFLLCVLVPGGDAAEEKDEKAAADAVAQPIKIDGTFEAIRQIEVTPGNEQLTQLVIQRIVPHGSKVTKEQSLVWFEAEPLDDKIRGAESDLAIARLDLKADEFAHEQFLKQQALDKAKTRRTRDLAQQAYDNYQRTDRERTIKQAAFSLASSEFSLESATEEYRQLEQMYKEDDLTEESEEIVLRRAKRAMENAEFALERAKIQHDRTIKQSVPRSDAEQEEALSRANIEYEKSMHAMTIDKQKRDLELERKRVKLEDQAEKFEEMRAERKNVVLKSEIDGIFVYGVITRAKLPAKPIEWKKDSTVTGKQVIGTVVDPSKLRVRVELPEDQLKVVQVGDRCKVVPKGVSDTEIDGVVKSISIVPFAAGKYDCIVTVRGKLPAEVLPAMTCELLFDAPEKSADDSEAKKDKPAK